jgi:hypothetical protein
MGTSFEDSRTFLIIHCLHWSLLSERGGVLCEVAAQAKETVSLNITIKHAGL